MKILKYIIFLSILSGIFFVIYRQSDEKGFRKWWTSLKIAVIMAAILAGLIPASTEAIEPSRNNNQVYQERLFSDQEFNSFEDNDQKVILVKTWDSAPSVPTSPGRGQPSQFPTPPSGGRTNRPVYVPKYRTAPKVVDQGLDAAANPAGAGGGSGAAEFDDNNPSSKNFDYDYRSNDPKKKKQSAEQCELDENVKDGKIEIVYRIKENPALIREAERMGRDQAAQKDVNNIIEQLSLGNENPGIGSKPVGEGITEFRGKNGGRILARESENGVVEILGKSGKRPKNQQYVIDQAKKVFPKNKK